MKSDWTEKVREKLSESTATPPDSIWAGISSELDTVIKIQSKHRRIGVWRWVAEAACLLAIITCGVNLFISAPSDNVIEIKYLSDNAMHNKSMVSTTVGPRQEMNIMESQTKDVEQSVAVEQSVIMAKSVSVAKDNIALLNQPSEEVTVDDNNEEMQTIETSDTSTVIATKIDHIEQLTDYSPVLKNGNNSNNKLSVSFYASNTNLPSLDSGINDISFGGIASSDPIYGGQYNPSGLVQNPELLGYKLKDTKHRQPIRLGASVRFPMSSTFSIATGVVYSHLSSTLTWENSNALSFETKQSLDYIGVPVSVDYNLPSYHSAGFYITGGAMVEKCIYGESHLVNSPITERVSEKALQMSVFLGAGAEFSLAKHLSIYAEPQVTFYINNHSDVKSIYKDRQINLDLRIGVRYSFNSQSRF